MERTANFSSSSIWKLTKRDKSGKGFGAPALTYIAEKKMESRLGRALNSEITSRPTSWGNLVEKRAFDLLSMDYKLISKERFSHPEITNWTGAPDLTTADAVGDIKCPFTLKSFCEMVDSGGSAEVLKDICEEYYWQLVSNSILMKTKFAELIIYVPYKKELSQIKGMVEEYEGDINEVNWVKYATDKQLPYLIEGGHYKNINVFKFEVPEADKIFLTESVKKAVELLIPVSCVS